MRARIEEISPKPYPSAPVPSAPVPSAHGPLYLSPAAPPAAAPPPQLWPRPCTAAHGGGATISLIPTCEHRGWVDRCGGGEGRGACCRLRDLLGRDMAPVKLAEHTGGVAAVWLCVLLSAQYAYSSRFEGPINATLVYFGCGLIPVGALHLGLIAQLWLERKNSERIDRLERRCDEYDARIRMLEARVDVPELHGQTEWIEEATPGPRSSRAHAPASGMA